MPSALHAFGLGHFARSLIWSLTDLWLAYYAHVRLGLPAWETGVLLAVSLAYSSALDLVLAKRFLRMQHQPQRVPRLQRVGAIATAVSGVLLFLPVAGYATHAFLGLVVTSLLFRTSYALYDVTQNALISLLPGDDDEAERFVALRAVVVPVAKLCIAATGFLVIGEVPSQVVGHEWMIAAPIAILIVGSALQLARYRPMPCAQDIPVERLADFPTGRLLPLLLATVAIGAAGLISRFLPFVTDVDSPYPAGAVLTFAVVLGSVSGPFVVTQLTRQLPGNTSPAMALAALTVVTAAALTLHPPFPMAIAMAVAYGVGLGGASVLIWGRVAKVVRDHAAHTGRRTDMTCFALLTMTIKLSIAASSLVLGRLLDAFTAHRPDTLAALVIITFLGGGFFTMALSIEQPATVRPRISF